MRARPILGDPMLARRFMALRRARVFGPGLSEAERAEIHHVRMRMELELGREGPGRIHLKFGAGGLVDIEFLVQVLQLTHGARHGALRTPSTRLALARLGALGLLPEATAQRLLEAHAFLRRLLRSLRLGQVRPPDCLPTTGHVLARLRAGGGSRRRPGAPRAPSRGGGVRARGVFSDRGGDGAGRRERVSAPERFYLVDGPSYLYRAYHAIGHLSTSRGLPTNATLGMTMMLWKLLREDAPTYMGVAWDAPGPTHRHQQFEAYKLQRPGMPKDLVEQIPWVRRSLEALSLPAAGDAGLRGGRHPGDRRPATPRQPRSSWCW